MTESTLIIANSVACECKQVDYSNCNECGHEIIHATINNDCKICSGMGYIKNPVLAEIGFEAKKTNEKGEIEEAELKEVSIGKVCGIEIFISA